MITCEEFLLRLIAKKEEKNNKEKNQFVQDISYESQIEIFFSVLFSVDKLRQVVQEPLIQFQ